MSASGHEEGDMQRALGHFSSVVLVQRGVQLIPVSELLLALDTATIFLSLTFGSDLYQVTALKLKQIGIDFAFHSRKMLGIHFQD